MKLVRTVVSVAALAAAAATGAGAAGKSPGFGFEVSSTGFRAIGAGAEGRSLGAPVGAQVVWRLKLRQLGRGSSHTVSSDNGFFRSPLLSNRVGHAIFWRRTASAGRFGFHDSVDRAGNGELVVLPSARRVDAGVRFIWATRASNLGNAYGVRWELLDGLRTVGSGTLHGATAATSQTFRLGERLGGKLLVPDLTLCVNARTGLVGRGWSGWARNCATLVL